MFIKEMDATSYECPLRVGTLQTMRVQHYCVGGRCPVWRWVEPDDFIKNYDGDYGYCGLGGKPVVRK